MASEYEDQHGIEAWPLKIQQIKGNMSNKFVLIDSIIEESVLQSQNISSRQAWAQAECVSYIVNVYVDSAICLVGFVSNTLVLVILQRDRYKVSNNYLMQVLAIYDILLLIFLLLYTVLRSVYPATGQMEGYYNIGDYIVAYVLPVGWIAQTGTIWITCTLAYERYLAVSKPFKAVRWCTSGNAKRLSLALSLFNLLFNLPRFIHYNLAAFHVDHNTTLIAHIKFNLSGWNSEVYHYMYHIALSWLFLFIIPLCGLIYFNHCLIKALRACIDTRGRIIGCEKQRRVSNLEMARTNSHVTACVIVLITKFIICQLPDFILAVMGSFLPVSPEFVIFSVLAQMLLGFNSCVNFFIYSYFHRKFHDFFKELHCIQCCMWQTTKQDKLSLYKEDASQGVSRIAPVTLTGCTKNRGWWSKFYMEISSKQTGLEQQHEFYY